MLERTSPPFATIFNTTLCFRKVVLATHWLEGNYGTASNQHAPCQGAKLGIELTLSRTLLEIVIVDAFGLLVARRLIGWRGEVRKCV
jgi:hypothetical protein